MMTIVIDARRIYRGRLSDFDYCSKFAYSFARRALIFATVNVILALTACGGGGSGGPSSATETKQVDHSWSIGGTHPPLTNFVVLPLTKSHDQAVIVNRPMGPLPLVPQGESSNANAEISATAMGDTYWVATQAPHGDVRDATSEIGSSVALGQTQVFRKITDTGSLTLVVSQATLETIDSNPHNLSSLDCPPLLNNDGVPISEGCVDAIDTQLRYSIKASKDVFVKDPNTGQVTQWLGELDLTRGDVFSELHGYIDNWHTAIGPGADSNLHFKVAPDPEYSDNVDNTVDRIHARVRLLRPTIIEIPLDAVKKDETFSVKVDVSASAISHRQLESFAGARFRDPQKSSGLSYVAQGVELVAIPADLVQVPPPSNVQPAPSCPGGSDPAAGTLQFESATFYTSEARVSGATLVSITRGGGGKGEVSAAITTQDATAHAGTDYQTVTTLVRFNDGEQGKRYLSIPIIDNQTPEADRTLKVMLSDPRGCVALGSQSQTVLTILDNDQPQPVTQFTVGGTITGLAGRGLVLREVSQGGPFSPTTDGPFTFANKVITGTHYDVRVDTQPSNPAQSCTVGNGNGLMGSADVNNVAVTCTTLQANGALDTSFGSGGIVSNTLSPAKALALQADGKLLVLGGLTLSRYNTSGSADTSFGTGGKVTIVASGGPVDSMQALALQNDGKIVVAGYTALPTSFNDDVVVLRYNSDGTLDTGFGTGGKVVTDFNGMTDRAFAVLVQTDGKIVVAGFATLGTQATADQDFALVRYQSTGSLDTGFGNGGKATVNVAGKADFGYAVALQSDAKIVVAGRVGVNGGSNPDFGVARFLANGSIDATFNTSGTARIDFGGGVWDEAGDLVIQADGKIVLGGYTQTTGIFRYALARLTGAGLIDTTFGSNGLLSTSFTGSNDFGRGLALQSDGKFVIAGQVAGTSSNSDFGIARYSSAGVLDTTFGAGGLVRVDFFGAFDSAYDVQIQADGRIIAAGSARNGATTGLGLARVLP